ncbi:profilin [Streptomyces sp. NPDC053750]|uniref:profilin n=1 Tax=Streptomyces sp. NPDC053750 TaxID=3365714 RepID=UPI0037CFDFBD
MDNNLLGSGCIAEAAIIGHDGETLAASADFTVSQSEADALLQGFKYPDSMFPTGFHVNGVKYFTLRSDDRTIQGKHGANDIISVKTSKTVVLGIHTNSATTRDAVMVVERLADYLIQAGY